MVLLPANDVDCHGKPLILHRLKQAEVSSAQPVVLGELAQFSREHPTVEDLGVPCLAPPALTERQGLLPIWKMWGSISRSKVLFFVTERKKEANDQCAAS